MRRGGTSWFRLYPKIAENAADPGKGVRMSKTKRDCRVTPSNQCKQVQPCCLALALGRSINDLKCCPEILPVGQLQAMPTLRKGGSRVKYLQWAAKTPTPIYTRIHSFEAAVVDSCSRFRSTSWVLHVLLGLRHSAESLRRCDLPPRREQAGRSRALMKSGVNHKVRT